MASDKDLVVTPPPDNSQEQEVRSSTGVIQAGPNCHECPCVPGSCCAVIEERITRQKQEMSEMQQMWNDCMAKYKELSNNVHVVQKTVDSLTTLKALNASKDQTTSVTGLRPPSLDLVSDRTQDYAKPARRDVNSLKHQPVSENSNTSEPYTNVASGSFEVIDLIGVKKKGREGRPCCECERQKQKIEKSEMVTQETITDIYDYEDPKLGCSTFLWCCRSSKNKHQNVKIVRSRL